MAFLCLETFWCEELPEADGGGRALAYLVCRNWCWRRSRDEEQPFSPGLLYCFWHTNRRRCERPLPYLALSGLQGIYVLCLEACGRGCGCVCGCVHVCSFTEALILSAFAVLARWCRADADSSDPPAYAHLFCRGGPPCAPDERQPDLDVRGRGHAEAPREPDMPVPGAQPPLQVSLRRWHHLLFSPVFLFHHLPFFPFFFVIFVLFPSTLFLSYHLWYVTQYSTITVDRT